MDYSIVHLISEIRMAKARETAEKGKRRALEEELLNKLKYEKKEGVTTFEEGPYKIKVTGKIDRKVNSDLLQEIAQENGLQSSLGVLCRWTPSINIKAWRECNPEITSILADAVTSKYASPSIKIEDIGQ